MKQAYKGVRLIPLGLLVSAPASSKS